MFQVQSPRAAVWLALLGACHPAVRPGAVPAPATFMPSEEPGRAFAVRDMFPGLPLQNPTFAVMPPRNPRLWFLGEREGRILAVPNREGATEAQTVLDLRRKTLGWQD